MGLKYPRRRASSVDPFDFAWSIVKDFYFDPSKISHRDLGGGVKLTTATAGVSHPPVIDYDYMRRVNRGSGFMPPMAPFVEGKHQPVNLPRNVVMEANEDGGIAPRRIDSHMMRERYRGHEGLPHYVGVNLSAMHGGEDDIPFIAESLAHEHGHAAIDDELMQVLYDEWKEANSAEEAQRAYDRHKARHEVGAYNLQFPGGEDAARAVRFALMTHPNYTGAHAFRDRSPPTPHIRESLE